MVLNLIADFKLGDLSSILEPAKFDWQRAPHHRCDIYAKSSRWCLFVITVTDYNVKLPYISMEEWNMEKKLVWNGKFSIWNGRNSAVWNMGKSSSIACPASNHNTSRSSKAHWRPCCVYVPAKYLEGSVRGPSNVARSVLSTWTVQVHHTGSGVSTTPMNLYYLAVQ